MTKKTVATWGILIMLLVSLFGTAAAQSGGTPSETTPEPTAEPGAKFFTHPVVKLLSAYFDREVAEDPTTNVTDPSAEPLPEESETLADGVESGLGPIGEQIAAYHEEGMGFGVLVKIYAMAEAAKAACDAETPVTPAADGTVTEPTCTPVTADELVTEFQAGTGMGALFKEYGKPALRGVGHVKHAVEEMGADTETSETVDGTTTNKTNGNKPDKTTKNDKTKPKNGKGPNK